MHIFITANSPGEIAGWVMPFGKKLKEKNPQVKITLLIPPCQYASGKEVKVAQKWPWIDRVIGPKNFLKYIFLGKKTSLLNSAEKSCILFLGGDPFYAAFLSKKLKIPAFAYTNRPRWRKYFKKFLVTDEKTKEKFVCLGVEPEKVEVVGHLALDSVEIAKNKKEIYENFKLSSTSFVISFLPGSRPVEIQFMLPFFIKTVDLIRKNFSNVQFLFILSPFADENKIKHLIEKEDAKIIGKERFLKIKTQHGTEVTLVEENPYEVISISDLAVTIPGTNNLQIAKIGTPMLIVVPLNKAELIPLDGIFGLINPKIPPFGFVRRHLVFEKSKKLKFVSLPNIIAGEEVVPEIRGILQAEDVAKKVVFLLKDPNLREKMANKLQTITGKKGAAEKIAKIILNE